MSVTYTFDVFSSLDGFGSYQPPGDWGGYWGKQGPEFLAHRLTQYAEPQRMVFGANTFRDFVEYMAPDSDDAEEADDWGRRMMTMPTTVISSTVESSLGWPDATIVSGDAVEAIARLKETSDLPMRSHGSMQLNRALMAAGLVDRLQVTIFPVISGQTGDTPLFKGAADFDLELLDSRLFDGRIQELTYRPTLH